MSSPATGTAGSRIPRVTVIIPAYNCAGFVAEAVESVLAQTYADYELVVVNDGSPDTAALERALSPYRDRLRYLVQENRGPGGARNAGIRASVAEFVAFLDSDDRWNPDFLAAQIRLLDTRPEVAIVYADAAIFGDHPSAGTTLMAWTPSQGEVTFESLVRLECTVLTSTVVARRESLLAAGLFDEDFFHSEDFDLWVRVASRGGRFDYQRRVLAEHRRHPSSLTAESGALGRATIRVCEKLLRALDLTPERRALLQALRDRSVAHLALEAGKASFLRGDYRDAARLFAESNRFLRSRKLRMVLVALRLAPRLAQWAYRRHIARLGMVA